MPRQGRQISMTRQLASVSGRSRTRRPQLVADLAEEDDVLGRWRCLPRLAGARNKACIGTMMTKLMTTAAIKKLMRAVRMARWKTVRC